MLLKEINKKIKILVQGNILKYLITTFLYKYK